VGTGRTHLDQPGLKEMTLKAIDILQARSNNKGWFMMSEAASIDKVLPDCDLNFRIALMRWADDACYGL